MQRRIYWTVAKQPLKSMSRKAHAEANDLHSKGMFLVSSEKLDLASRKNDSIKYRVQAIHSRLDELNRLQLANENFAKELKNRHEEITRVHSPEAYALPETLENLNKAIGKLNSINSSIKGNSTGNSTEPFSNNKSLLLLSSTLDELENSFLTQKSNYEEAWNLKVKAKRNLDKLNRELDDIQGSSKYSNFQDIQSSLDEEYEQTSRQLESSRNIQADSFISSFQTIIEKTNNLIVEADKEEKLFEDAQEYIQKAREKVGSTIAYNSGSDELITAEVYFEQGNYALAISTSNDAITKAKKAEAAEKAETMSSYSSPAPSTPVFTNDDNNDSNDIWSSSTFSGGGTDSDW